MQAMILAAGFGTRLLPFTKKKPKPLFPLLNVPILQITIEKLEKAGFDHIIVNAHHLREQIKVITSRYPSVHLQEETEILGTGGGLRQASEELRDEPVLIINGDIYHTIDPLMIYRHHQHQNNRVTLAVHDYPRFNTLEIVDDRLFGFNGRGKSGSLAFTGIHVLNPDILEAIPLGEKSCIIEHYANLLAYGELFSLLRVDDFFWTDMGTPQDYLNLHASLLAGAIPKWNSQLHLRDENTFISDKASIGKSLQITDWASIGDAIIGDNVHINRSVIWDGAVIPSNSVVTDSIVTDECNGK